jgi:hypothetical protein
MQMQRLLIVGVLLAVVLVSTRLRAEQPTDTEKHLVSHVDARLAEWWLKPAEQRFDQIGWAADVRTARKLAAEANRPLFLFTMDGRVNTGRC